MISGVETGFLPYYFISILKSLGTTISGYFFIYLDFTEGTSISNYTYFFEPPLFFAVFHGFIMGYLFGDFYTSICFFEVILLEAGIWSGESALSSAFVLPNFYFCTSILFLRISSLIYFIYSSLFFFFSSLMSFSFCLRYYYDSFGLFDFFTGLAEVTIRFGFDKLPTVDFLGIGGFYRNASNFRASSWGMCFASRGLSILTQAYSKYRWQWVSSWHPLGALRESAP